MKFSIKLLSLLSVTCAFAEHVKYSPECLKDLEEFDDCRLNCELYSTEKCQNYYKDPLAYLPHCKEDFDEDETRILLNGIKTDEAICIIDSSKDENNKGCPLSTLDDKIFDKEETDYLGETCKSKKCTEAAIKAYTIYSEVEKNTDRLYITDYYDKVLEGFVKCSNGETVGDRIKYESKELYFKKSSRRCHVKKNKN